MKLALYGSIAAILAASASSSTNAYVDSSPVSASIQPLKTSGKVSVSLTSGRMEGQICLANRPTNYREAFSLNAGLNVAKVTDGDGHLIDFDGWYDAGVDGEARVYTINSSSPTICVDYVGAFPVYPQHDAPLDFKGVIAFNGESVRATEQSAWLPLPYDTKAKSRLNSTAYDLNVICAECTFIYVNGSDPVDGKSGQFASERSRPAMLFAGIGPITRDKSVTIINETLAPMESAALVRAYRRIEMFYGKYLGQKIHDTPAIMRVVALNQAERDRKGSEWGFATWPTIAFSGSIRPIATALINGGEIGERRLGYLAHEIGHYYFGTLADPDGPYQWFLLESTAEFLSLKARGAIDGAAAEQQRIDSLAEGIVEERAPFKGLDEITDSEEIGDTYRYNYGPLLLISLERQVGERKMAKFMQGLLSTSNIRTWQDLEMVARNSEIDKTEWEAWRRKCIRNGTRACTTSAK